jgi:predicted deacylase
MLQLQLFDTYSNLFSSMEQQLHKGKFPLMLFKNITKKRDVRERIFRTTQATFVTELRADIVQDLKKLASSTTVVHIHPHNHPHFAYTNSLHQISAACFILFFFFFF